MNTLLIILCMLFVLVCVILPFIAIRNKKRIIKILWTIGMWFVVIFFTSLAMDATNNNRDVVKARTEAAECTVDMVKVEITTAEWGECADNVSNLDEIFECDFTAYESYLRIGAGLK